MPKTFRNPFSINANTGEAKWRMWLELCCWITHCDTSFLLFAFVNRRAVSPANSSTWPFSPGPDPNRLALHKVRSPSESAGSHYLAVPSGKNAKTLRSPSIASAKSKESAPSSGGKQLTSSSGTVYTLKFGNDGTIRKEPVGGGKHRQSSINSTQLNSGSFNPQAAATAEGDNASTTTPLAKKTSVLHRMGKAGRSSFLNLLIKFEGAVGAGLPWITVDHHESGHSVSHQHKTPDSFSSTVTKPTITEESASPEATKDKHTGESGSSATKEKHTTEESGDSKSPIKEMTMDSGGFTCTADKPDMLDSDNVSRKSALSTDAAEAGGDKASLPKSSDATTVTVPQFGSGVAAAPQFGSGVATAPQLGSGVTGGPQLGTDVAGGPQLGTDVAGAPQLGGAISPKNLLKPTDAASKSKSPTSLYTGGSTTRVGFGKIDSPNSSLSRQLVAFEEQQNIGEGDKSVRGITSFRPLARVVMLTRFLMSLTGSRMSSATPSQTSRCLSPAMANQLQKRLYDDRLALVLAFLGLMQLLLICPVLAAASFYHLQNTPPARQAAIKLYFITDLFLIFNAAYPFFVIVSLVPLFRRRVLRLPPCACVKACCMLFCRKCCCCCCCCCKSGKGDKPAAAAGRLVMPVVALESDGGVKTATTTSFTTELQQTLLKVKATTPMVDLERVNSQTLRRHNSLHMVANRNGKLSSIGEASPDCTVAAHGGMPLSQSLHSRTSTALNSCTGSPSRQSRLGPQSQLQFSPLVISRSAPAFPNQSSTYPISRQSLLPPSLLSRSVPPFQTLPPLPQSVQPIKVEPAAKAGDSAPSSSLTTSSSASTSSGDEDSDEWTSSSSEEQESTVGSGSMDKWHV
jgi:hypothetical protein